MDNSSFIKSGRGRSQLHQLHWGDQGYLIEHYNQADTVVHSVLISFDHLNGLTPKKKGLVFRVIFLPTCSGTALQ